MSFEGSWPSVALQDEMRKDSFNPYLRFCVWYGTPDYQYIELEDILNFHQHTYGRLGQANLSFVVNNADDANSWLLLCKGHKFRVQIGAVINGVPDYAVTESFYITSVTASGPGLPQRISVTAVNASCLLDQPIPTSVTYSGQTLLTIAFDLCTTAGFDAGKGDSSTFWDNILTSYTAKKGNSFLFHLNELCGINSQSYARALGFSTFVEETFGIGFFGAGLSPSVDHYIGATDTPRVRSITRIVRRTPSTIVVQGAGGLVRQVQSTVMETALGANGMPFFEPNLLFLPQFSTAAVLEARAKAELVINAGMADTVLVECDPDLSLQHWSVVQVTGLSDSAADLPDTTALRVAEIWLDYKPSQFTFKFLAWRCYDDLGYVTTTPDPVSAQVTLASGADNKARTYAGLSFDGNSLSIDPVTAAPPLALGTNAQGQRVPGLNADTVDGIHATGFETAGSIATHAALTTGVHGLAITPGQTLAVTIGGTLSLGGYTLTAPTTGQALVAAVGATTIGHIPFYSSTTGSLSSDSSLFWDNTNKRLGLGTTTPAGKLSINGGFASTLLNGDEFILRKITYTGGWARSLMEFQEHDGSPHFKIGAFGSDNTLAYGFIGQNYDNPAITWDLANYVRIGGLTDYAQISPAGVLTLSGTAKRHLSMRPYIEQGSIAGAGKPTIVTRGASKGYSMPLYASDEELFVSEYIAGRWDGASDITLSIIGYLSADETADDDFALQVSWTNKATGSGTWPDTTTDVTVVTNIPDARKAQYSIYKVDFTIDWDGPATDIAASDFFAARIRRVAVGAGNVEMDGEFVITSIIISYVVDKLYKV